MSRKTIRICKSIQSIKYARHQHATSFVKHVYQGAVWVLLCLLAASAPMDKKMEVDNLEMRLQALESRIYGERRNKSGKPVKVRPE